MKKKQQKIDWLETLEDFGSNQQRQRRLKDLKSGNKARHRPKGQRRRKHSRV